MGSPFNILVYPGGGRRPASEQELLAAVNTAYAELAAVEDMLADFRDSPLSRVNAGILNYESLNFEGDLHAADKP